MLYAYEGGVQKYKGELVTDRNDDMIRAINLPPQGFSYNHDLLRQFSGLQID